MALVPAFFTSTISGVNVPSEVSKEGILMAASSMSGGSPFSLQIISATCLAESAPSTEMAAEPSLLIVEEESRPE